MSNYQDLKNLKSLSANNESCNNTTIIDDFLKKECNENNKQPWSKLSKLIKNKKIDDYVNKYKVDNPDLILTDTELNTMKKYLKQQIENKKLSKVKDIVYNKDEGNIQNIPNLDFNKQTRKFTLKQEKKVSTLKSLAPKRGKATRKASPKDKKKK